MKVNEIAFVCFPVKSLQTAQAFYEGLLGLKPTSTWVQNDTSGMIEYDIGSSTISIGAGAPNFVPGKTGAGVALELEDFDLAVKELKAKGVTFIMEPMETGVCNMAVVEDPDGNNIMLHKRKPK